VQLQEPAIVVALRGVVRLALELDVHLIERDADALRRAAEAAQIEQAELTDDVVQVGLEVPGVVRQPGAGLEAGGLGRGRWRAGRWREAAKKRGEVGIGLAVTNREQALLDGMPLLYCGALARPAEQVMTR